MSIETMFVLIGLGILSSPYAMAHAGWLGGLISLVVAATFAYAAQLMVRCQQKTGCATYQELATMAVGKKSCILIQTFFYVEVVGSLLGFCISVADNLGKAFEGITKARQLGIGNSSIMTSQNVMMVMACLFVLPTVWLRNLKALSFTSIWSVAMSGILVLSVAITASPIDGNIGFPHRIPLVGSLYNAPVATGIYAFAYSGTTIFPAIYSSMKDPSKFPHALSLSFAITIIAVSGLGIMGAMMFGHETASQITLNMPPHRITTKIMVWMTVLTPLLKFALLLSPLSVTIDRFIMFGHLSRHYGARTQLMMTTFARSIVMVLIVVGAIVLPYFNYVISLIGSSVSIALCLIFPCIFYLNLCRDRLTHFSFVTLLFVFVFAITAAICGTIISFHGLVVSKRGSSA